MKALHEFRTRLAESKQLILEGVEALKQQQLAKALACFRKSVDESPENPVGFYYIGVTLGRQGESDRALTAYQRALEIKPDYAQAHSSEGLLYWRATIARARSKSFARR